jgi:hypothetical protein
MDACKPGPGIQPGVEVLYTWRGFSVARRARLEGGRLAVALRVNVGGAIGPFLLWKSRLVVLDAEPVCYSFFFSLVLGLGRRRGS